MVELVNASGSVQAVYTYDAWGKVLSVKDSAGNNITSWTHIANINPLRYRGYYYDTETGFYYLQSRYYDPVTHRFINADSYASTGQGIVGTNMFAYCNNNPVTCADAEGNRPFANYMMTDSGHFVWPNSVSEVVFENDNGTLHDFYEDNIEKKIEKTNYNGKVTSIIARYDGTYHSDTFWEKVGSGILEVGITEGLSYIAGKFSAFPLSAFFGVVAVVVDSAKAPDLKSGVYDCYTVIVTSQYTDSTGVTYSESVFYKYFINEQNTYSSTEIWRSAVDPSQVYYFP